MKVDRVGAGLGQDLELLAIHLLDEDIHSGRGCGNFERLLDVPAGGRDAENGVIFMSIVSYVVHVCYHLSIVTHTPAFYQN